MKKTIIENTISKIINDLEGMRPKVVAIAILSELERLGMKPSQIQKEVNGDRVKVYEWEDES